MSFGTFYVLTLSGFRQPTPWQFHVSGVLYTVCFKITSNQQSPMCFNFLTEPSIHMWSFIFQVLQFLVSYFPVLHFQCHHIFTLHQYQLCCCTLHLMLSYTFFITCIDSLLTLGGKWMFCLNVFLHECVFCLNVFFRWFLQKILAVCY